LEENQGHKIGWIAHRRELLQQALDTNDQFFNVQDIHPISMFTRTPEQYKDCTAVVVDECQHDASASCAILHQVIRPKIIIGLTATPYRTDRAQLSFQKVIRDAGIRQLIREGYLAQFNQWILDCDWSPENVARTYVEDQQHWGKSVVYFLTIKEAHACTELLKKNGVRAALITGSSPRDEILRDFSAGEYDVLCNVAVLTEGFDEPTLNTVFVRPGSKGPTVQMAGRALRKHETTPIVNIVQNNRTKYPFTRHACATDQYIKRDKGWRNIDPKNLRAIFQSQIHKLTQVKVEMPDFLKAENKNVVVVE
jgi:superfamily II DNA or RNA helicase